MCSIQVKTVLFFCRFLKYYVFIAMPISSSMSSSSISSSSTVCHQHLCHHHLCHHHLSHPHLCHHHLCPLHLCHHHLCHHHLSHPHLCNHHLYHHNLCHPHLCHPHLWQSKVIISKNIINFTIYVAVQWCVLDNLWQPHCRRETGGWLPLI